MSRILVLILAACSSEPLCPWAGSYGEPIIPVRVDVVGASVDFTAGAWGDVLDGHRDDCEIVGLDYVEEQQGVVAIFTDMTILVSEDEAVLSAGRAYLGYLDMSVGPPAIDEQDVEFVLGRIP